MLSSLSFSDRQTEPRGTSKHSGNDVPLDQIVGQRKMFDVNETIGQLSNRHQSALRWFMDHREEERAWPGSMPDGTLLVNKAKGIYKCWQPAKVAHFETREIRGRMEVL